MMALLAATVAGRGGFPEDCRLLGSWAYCGGLTFLICGLPVIRSESYVSYRKIAVRCLPLSVLSLPRPPPARREEARD